MMKHLKYCLFFFLLLFTWQSYAQRRVLGNPEIFVDPIDPFVQNNYETFISAKSTQDKLKNKAWWVVVDRDNVKAYDKPGGNIISPLRFGSAYYVTDETESWVELVDALVDKVDIKKIKMRIGWVRKNDLLLWNHSLLNPSTKIHQKAFLVNRFDDLKDITCENKDLVHVYNAPAGSNLKENLHTFEFYFIYKKEGTRYLLGETSQLSIYEPAFLLGWVEKAHIAEWNTRIALEPNNTEKGFNERKNNPAFQVYGFNDFEKVEAFKNGKIGADQADFNIDPVKPGQELSKSDGRRLAGNFMRFPIISNGDYTPKGGAYVKSAVFDYEALKLKCPTAGDQSELLKPMYFCRQPVGARYRSFSYVLFWPHRDLARYYSYLEKKLIEIPDLPPSGKRIALQDIYHRLLNEFIGGENNKEIEEYSIDDILEVVQGIKGDGVDFNAAFLHGNYCPCFTDQRRVSDEDVNELIDYLANSQKMLRKILNHYDKDDCAFNHNGEYFFWVKLTDLF